MIRELRVRHRAMTTGLAVLAPLGLALALAARRPMPVESGEGVDPLDWDGAPAPRGAPVGDRVVAWVDGELRLASWDDPDGGGRVLELEPRVAIRRPDVLVYWSPDPADGALPERVYWLGELLGTRVRRFPLPPPAQDGGGHLLLYSLGHHEVVLDVDLGG